MVVVNMNPMPLKVIGKKACLWTKGPSKLLKDHGPKRCPNIGRNEKSKVLMDFVKIKEGGVHHKRYNGCCTKQWVRIPKATWTSPILKRRSTC